MLRAGIFYNESVMGTIVAWAYEASLHCPDCAYARFGNDLHKKETRDSNGNPLHPIFSHENDHRGQVCDVCREPLE